jgi:hypothetical protein
MESTEQILRVALFVGLDLAALLCFLYVTYKLLMDKGVLHALFGFLCCQLYPFLWGWFNASRFRIRDIMLFWTFLSVLALGVQYVFYQQIREDLLQLLALE